MMHTPGPWRVRASMHGKRYRCVQIGSDENYTTLELEPADARLIAAAPDLLAFIKEWLADFTAAGPTDSPHEAQARALIAKAEQ